MNAIVNFSNQHYIAFQKRLRESLARHAQSVRVDVNLFWTDELPPGSPSHFAQPYAFKLYAINEARRQGARCVLWLDSGLYAIRPLGPLWEIIERDGVYLVEDANSLAKFCSDETLDYFKLTRDQVRPMHLMSGALIGLRFDHPNAENLMRSWWNAYEAGLYHGTVSKHSGMEDHRGDETILGILMNQYGIAAHSSREHFSSDGNVQPTTIFRSGYFDREVIAEHTVMVPSTGPVLDVGARSFAFSREMARRDHTVVAMEPDPTVSDPKIERVHHLPYALGASIRHDAPFIMDADPQARRIGEGGAVRVDVLDIATVMKRMAIPQWGVVKLDCEGAEYEVLRNWPGPIAEQVTVEFHEHVKPQPQEVYDAIFAHMGQWYDVKQHVKSERHCLPPNWWDTVWVLR